MSEEIEVRINLSEDECRQLLLLNTVMDVICKVQRGIQQALDDKTYARWAEQQTVEYLTAVDRVLESIKALRGIGLENTANSHSDSLRILVSASRCEGGNEEIYQILLAGTEL